MKITLAASVFLAAAAFSQTPPAAAPATPNMELYYRLAPDAMPQEGVPKGQIKGPFVLPSNAYPGTQHTYWVYVPAQYDPAIPASLMIYQDGQAFMAPEGDIRAQFVMDNLIYRREIPIMIGVFINPGRRPDQPEPTLSNWGDRDTNRPTEYNTLDDKYARVIVDDIAKINTDAELHATVGGDVYVTPGHNLLDRKRALDVVQELQARPQILAAIERWLKPPVAGTATLDLSAYDPWLAQLVAGELAALEPTLVALRRPALFASLAGPALAELAAAATARTLDDVLFDLGATGDAMFVVTAGALVAKRAGAPDRRIEIGGVVGELAVLTRAPRAATVVAAEGGASVLAIDRAAFTEAARRAPELVLGLSATLAGWLAPNRPDLL